MQYTLFPWQQACIDAWLGSGARGIAKVVTGAGKTRMALHAAKILEKRIGKPLKVRILVPKVFLAQQWQNAVLQEVDFLEVGTKRIGQWNGNRKDKPIRDWMVYVVNSARYVISRQILEDFSQGSAVLFIIDECHHFASEENKHVFDFLQYREKGDDYYALGLSATPETAMFETVSVPTIGPVVFTYGFSHALAEGIINPFVMFHLGLYLDEKRQERYEALSLKITKQIATMYRLYPLLCKLNDARFFVVLHHLAQSNEGLVSEKASILLSSILARRALVSLAPIRMEAAQSLVERLGPNKKILVYGERIEQCEVLHQQFLALGYSVAHYHSKMGRIAKEENLRRFRDGEARILVCCKALDEGFDIPSVDVGIVLSCTSEERQRVQRLGRILRKREGKGYSALYYLHVEGTVERTTMLESSEGTGDICFMTYTGGAFFHPAYDELSQRVLLMCRQRTNDSKQLATLDECLEQGQLRPDWLLPMKMLQDHVKTAKDFEEHNYWIAMLLMRQEKDKEDESR